MRGWRATPDFEPGVAAYSPATPDFKSISKYAPY